MLPIKELDKLKPWLVSVIRVGSRSLPFIENPHDHDYLFYVHDNKDLKKCVNLFKLKETYGQNEDWGVNDYETFKPRPRWAYQYNFHEAIYGDYCPKFDFVNNANAVKKELVDNAYGKQMSDIKKGWYHVLANIYVLETGSNEFTDEQKKNINLCHDCKITEEIYNYIQSVLEKYNKELS